MTTTTAKTSLHLGHAHCQTVSMGMPPLGGYEQLLQSGARPWSAGTIVHGSKVLDDLVDSLTRHNATDWTTEYSRRLGPRAAVVGCVPWLTDHAVTQALASFDQCCIVVDKQQPEYSAVRQLANDGSFLSSAYLDGFDEIGLPDEDGNPPVIHPGSSRFAVELGPIRVAGWRRAENGTPRPMLHAKMLVLGVTTYYEDDEEFAGDILRFHPRSTWMGSANWTKQARNHIEFGLWSTDRELVQHNYEYLLSLLKFSEPRGTSTVGPEPELMSATWDDVAFAEYWAEYHEQSEGE